MTLNIRQQPRHSLNQSPDWNSTINRAKDELQEQINALQNRSKLNIISNTSLFTNSPTALMTTLSGTNNLAKNMFNVEVVPQFDSDDTDNWFTVLDTTSPFYGVLQYKGTSSISAIVDVTFTATTPTDGQGDATKGWNITANLYLAETGGNFIPVNTQYDTDKYKCKNGLPLLLACYPLARTHTGHARYKLTINNLDRIMVKLNTSNTADTAACSVYQAKINITTITN